MKIRYIKASQGKENLLQLISESEISEQVYNSNAIENSTLSFDDTEKILRQIDLDRFINERELFETKNLARVTEHTNKKAQDKDLNSDKIVLLHKMLLSNIRDEIAGRFREKGEWVRVIINYLLIREGYAPINIKFLDRSLYYQAFKLFDEKNDTWIMEEVVEKALSNSLYKRIAYLEGKEIILLSDYAKREKISHSNLLNKASRQTIPAFTERGKWRIGV